MLILQIDSSIVNAVLFIGVDIIGLWAIHRGLKALQGYYIYYYVSKGGTIPLARSRIPILSGELLRGNTRLPSIFIVCNGMMIVLAFVATLGVNGQSGTTWLRRPDAFNAITSLVSGKPANGSTRARSLVCSSRAEDELVFWPYAFYYNARSDIEYSGTCQRGAPDTKPLLSVNCVRYSSTLSNSNYRSADPCYLTQSRRFTISLKTDYNLDEKTLSRMKEYNVTVDRHDLNRFMGKKGRLLIFEGPKRVAIVILYSKNDYSIFFRGTVDSFQSGFAEITAPNLVRVQPAIVLNPKSALSASLRNLSYVDLQGPNSFASSILEKLVERSILIDSLRGKAYGKSPEYSTAITTYSIIIFSILLATSVLLGFMKEIMSCVLRNRSLRPLEWCMSDFDVISRLYRTRMEDSCGLEPSGRHSVLGKYVDKNNVSRTGVTVPLVAVSKQVNSGIDLCRESVCTHCAGRLKNPSESQVPLYFFD